MSLDKIRSNSLQEAETDFYGSLSAEELASLEIPPLRHEEISLEEHPEFGIPHDNETCEAILAMANYYIENSITKAGIKLTIEAKKYIARKGFIDPNFATKADIKRGLLEELGIEITATTITSFLGKVMAELIDNIDPETLSQDGLSNNSGVFEVARFYGTEIEKILATPQERAAARKAKREEEEERKRRRTLKNLGYIAVPEGLVVNVNTDMQKRREKQIAKYEKKIEKLEKKAKRYYDRRQIARYKTLQEKAADVLEDTDVPPRRLSGNLSMFAWRTKRDTDKYERHKELSLPLNYSEAEYKEAKAKILTAREVVGELTSGFESLQVWMTIAEDINQMQQEIEFLLEIGDYYFEGLAEEKMIVRAYLGYGATPNDSKAKRRALKESPLEIFERMKSTTFESSKDYIYDVIAKFIRWQSSNN